MSAEADFLRHTVATIAYRASRALNDPPAEFASSRVGPDSRSAQEIVAHMGDVLAWAAGSPDRSRGAADRAWNAEVERFYRLLELLDERFERELPGSPPERLLQGPLADVLTHVGQLAMLRRLAGAPIPGEDFFEAEIVVGRVGPEQASPRRLMP